MAGGIIAARGPIIRKNGLMGRVTEHEMTDGRRDESHAVVKRGRETEGEDSPTRRDESYVVVKRIEEIEGSDPGRRDEESYVVMKRTGEIVGADGPTRRDESYVVVKEPKRLKVRTVRPVVTGSTLWRPFDGLACIYYIEYGLASSLCVSSESLGTSAHPLFLCHSDLTLGEMCVSCWKSE